MRAALGRGERWGRAAGTAIIIGAIIGVLLVGTDRLLGLLGYPPAVPIQWTHPPNFTETRESAEFRYTFATNSRGLRYAEIPVEKEPRELRVVMLGDSFTEGDGVELDQTFGSLLEGAYQQRGGNRKVRFINGGLSGKGPLEYWRLFSKVGLAYQPDLVLIMVMANDVENMSERFSREDLSRVYERGEKKGVKRLAHVVLPHVYTILEQARRQEHLRVERQRPILERILEEARRRGIAEVRIAAWQASLPAEILRDAARLKPADARSHRGVPGHRRPVSCPPPQLSSRWSLDPCGSSRRGTGDRPLARRDRSDPVNPLGAPTPAPPEREPLVAAQSTARHHLRACSISHVEVTGRCLRCDRHDLMDLIR